MELIDWDEHHDGAWDWLCVGCGRDGWITTRTLGEVINNFEYDVICPTCKSPDVVIEKRAPLGACT